jgi:hypothetical protein
LYTCLPHFTLRTSVRAITPRHHDKAIPVLSTEIQQLTDEAVILKSQVAAKSSPDQRCPHCKKAIDSSPIKGQPATTRRKTSITYFHIPEQGDQIFKGKEETMEMLSQKGVRRKDVAK